MISWNISVEIFVPEWGFFFPHLGLELKSFPFEPDKQITTSGDLTSR